MAIIIEKGEKGKPYHMKEILFRFFFYLQILFQTLYDCPSVALYFSVFYGLIGQLLL